MMPRVLEMGKIAFDGATSSSLFGMRRPGCIRLTVVPHAEMSFCLLLDVLSQLG